MPSVATRLTNKEAELQAFEEECAIPGDCPIEVENEAKRILTMTPDVLRKYSAQACNEATFILNQFAFFLQKALNLEQGRINWAEENLKRMVLKQNIAGYGLEDKKMKLIKEDDAAEALDNIRVQATFKKGRIAFLDDKVKEMAKSLAGLANSKRGS